MSQEFFFGVVIAIPLGIYFLVEAIRGLQSGLVDFDPPPGLQAFLESATFSRTMRPKSYWAVVSSYAIGSIILLIFGLASVLA